jgi:fibronectin-binding autotransporter adhesin
VIYVSGAVNPAIEGLDIVGGDATGLGGAPAADAGGGIYAITATLTLRDSRVMTNTAGSGAGLYLNAANAVLERNVIANNSATGDGGGIYAWDSGCTLINNAVVDNQAGGVGSGLYIAGYRSLAAPEALLLHTTIARNSGGDGSGVYVTNFYGTSTVVMTNTIIAGHTVGITVTAGNTATLNATLWHTNGTDYVGNVIRTNDHSGDPAFALDGYHLTLSSAAIDAGVGAGVTTDIDGDARPDGCFSDIGADEFITGAECRRIYLPIILRRW